MVLFSSGRQKGDAPASLHCGKLLSGNGLFVALGLGLVHAEASPESEALLVLSPAVDGAETSTVVLMLLMVVSRRAAVAVVEEEEVVEGKESRLSNGVANEGDAPKVAQQEP
jgi:hypothetical protein